MQRLIPIDVPWQVALCVPDIVVTARELGAATLTFRADWLRDSKLEEHETSLQLNGGLWMRIEPTISEGESLSQNDYDFSRIPLHGLALVDRDEWSRQYFSKWASTGCCPDPNVYLVNTSTWAAGLSTFPGSFRHIVVVGEDIVVHSLCHAISWECDSLGSSGTVDLEKLT